MGQDLNPGLSGIKTLILSTSVPYHIQADAVRIVCPITCHKKKKTCRFSDSKTIREVINAGGPHLTRSLSDEDQAEPYIL